MDRKLFDADLTAEWTEGLLTASHRTTLYTASVTIKSTFSLARHDDCAFCLHFRIALLCGEACVLPPRCLRSVCCTWYRSICVCCLHITPLLLDISSVRPDSLFLRDENSRAQTFETRENTIFRNWRMVSKWKANVPGKITQTISLPKKCEVKDST